MNGKSWLVALGASDGGVTALLDLVHGLPADFPAPVCVVLHIGAHPSVLPELLTRRGPLRAVHAHDGQLLEAGRVFVAPPDHHLLIEGGGTLRLDRGPKENHARPSIDPLFRSAALHWRERAIGVILSGQLDDGAAGLRAIADCGGRTLVQSPATALQPEMPRNAIAAVDADHVLPPAQLAQELVRMVRRTPAAAHAEPPPTLVHESELLRQRDILAHLRVIAEPSTFSCPECGGVLWQLRDGRPLRWRCHTGHAFTARSLEHAQSEVTQEALWTALRSLQEREMLLRRVATATHAAGDAGAAAAGQAQADQLRVHIEELARLIGDVPAERADA